MEKTYIDINEIDIKGSDNLVLKNIKKSLEKRGVSKMSSSWWLDEIWTDHTDDYWEDIDY